MAVNSFGLCGLVFQEQHSLIKVKILPNMGWLLLLKKRVPKISACTRFKSNLGSRLRSKPSRNIKNHAVFAAERWRVAVNHIRLTSNGCMQGCVVSYPMRKRRQQSTSIISEARKFHMDLPRLNPK